MAGLSADEEKAVVTIYRSQKRENGTEGEELFNVAHRSNRMRLAEGNFRFNIRETIF